MPKGFVFHSENAAAGARRRCFARTALNVPDVATNLGELIGLLAAFRSGRQCGALRSQDAGARPRLPHGAMSALAFGASPSPQPCYHQPPARRLAPVLTRKCFPNPSSKSRRYQDRPSRFQALTNEGETIEPLKWDCQQRYQVKEPER